MKYYRFLKDSLLGLPRGGGVVTVFGRQYHYNDPFGLASLQRVYCEHYGLRSHVGDSAIVMDVGAHIGQFNFFCSHYLKARRVISIEPVSASYELLKLNALDPDDCFHEAISNQGRAVTMYVSKSSSQQSTYVRSSGDTYGESFDIPAESLDELGKRSGLADVDVLKIDTEGSEYDIVLSGEQVLQKARIVVVEMGILKESSGSIFKTGEFLERQHFVLRELDCFEAFNPAMANGVFERIVDRENAACDK